MPTSTPTPRYAQHFLIDTLVVDRLVDMIAPRAGERMVEIGPGNGVLTDPLLAALGSLDVVEIDPQLATRLQRRFGPRSGLRVHQVDALTFDFEALALADQPLDRPKPAPEKRLRVVGNLPYYISTPLLFHVLTCATTVKDMIFMLQLEVAQRLVAQPGSREYGRLSVMAQYRCGAELVFDVPPKAFRPSPKVHSAVVRLTPKAPLQPACDEYWFTTLVSKAFAQRRKTLRNALRSEIDTDTLSAAGIDPERRAETVSVSEFVRLANRIGDSS